MAKFYFNGADTIAASFQDLANLTPEDTLNILRPAAQLLMEAQKAKEKSTFTQRSGSLYNSIKLEERIGETGAAIRVHIVGKHPNAYTGRRMKDGRPSGRYSGSNAEVAYILEQGSPRISPRYWIETTNEENEEAVNAAMGEAWDAYLTEKGL